MARRRSRRQSGDLLGGLASLLFFGIIVGFYMQMKPVTNEQLLLTFVVGLGIALTASLFFIWMVRVIRNRFNPPATMTTDFSFPELSRNQQASQFEREVAALIQQLTGNQTEVVGGAGDGGIDIKVYNKGKRLIGVVQCKNVQPTKILPPTYIRDLNTAKHYAQVNTAYLATTGKFSNESMLLAKELGVRLISGKELQNLRAKATPQSSN